LVKGKKKIEEGVRQGPKGGTQPPESGSGQKDISKVRCFACGEMGHYVGQCPKRKKKRQKGGMAATTEEEEFNAQFARECAFVSYLSVDTPSNVRWGDRVEEDLLTQSIDSEGAQTQFSRTPSSGVTGPPRTTSVLELSRQRVGAGASEHQRLMRRSSRAPQRLEPHLAMETGRSASGSTSGGSHLVRGQVEDLGEMPRSRYSW
jgi:hypothetical protein